MIQKVWLLTSEYNAYDQYGVLVCGDYELDDFISYLMTGIDEIIDERIQQAREDWQNSWDDEQ